MRKIKLFFRNQKGYLTIIAAFLIVFIGFLGTTVAYMIFSGSMSSFNFSQGTAALYVAESGIEKTTRYLLTPTFGGSSGRIACSAVTSNGDLTNASLGSGTFTVTTVNSSPIYATNTLNGAITSSATTITATSTSGFAPSGRIMIDKELMRYAAISGNNFTGVTRGIDSTTAAAHITGAPVGQYQCSLDSKGGIPNLTSPLQQREIQKTVQLQDGWTVGDFSSSNFRRFRWNRSTELAWNDGSGSGSQNLNSVYMLSYADGWAVGDSETFLRWNGSSWATVAAGLPGTVNYNGVFCNASDDCHVVGDTNSSAPLIADWDGTSWTRDTPATTTNAALQSVHCSASNNCWAVGARNAGTKIFYSYNGTSWSGTSVAAALTDNNSFPFLGVFCNSSSDCWAVGSNDSFARYTGSWSAYATGLGTGGTNYNAITCTSSNNCWAVGDVNGGQDLIARWNGTSWTRVSAPTTSTANLRGVDCANANDCWAVGATSRFVHWDGTSWTNFTTSGLASITLNSISLIHPNSQPQSLWQEIFA